MAAGRRPGAVAGATADMHTSCATPVAAWPRHCAWLPPPAAHCSRRHRRSPIAAAAQPDPYKVVGVARGSSRREIRAAYIEQIKQLHPDVSVSGEDTTLQAAALNAAYERLMEGGWAGTLGCHASLGRSRVVAAGTCGGCTAMPCPSISSSATPRPAPGQPTPACHEMAPTARRTRIRWMCLTGLRQSPASSLSTPLAAIISHPCRCVAWGCRPCAAGAGAAVCPPSPASCGPCSIQLFSLPPPAVGAAAGARARGGGGGARPLVRTATAGHQLQRGRVPVPDAAPAGGGGWRAGSGVRRHGRVLPGSRSLLGV